MYYEFYIDVFFVVNLLLDFLALCLTNQILVGTAKPLRSFLGALLGALGICAFLLLSGKISLGRIVIFSLLSSVLMAAAGCGFFSFPRLLLETCTLYGVSFLLGGFLNLLPGNLRRKCLLFFTITVTTYFILNIGIRLCKYLKGKAVRDIDVILEKEGRKTKIKGLRDTGNRLVDRNTGKPVSVVEYSCFQELLEEREKTALESFCAMKEAEAQKALEQLKPRFLLYNSVGCPGGMLPVVTIDRMTIVQEGKRWLIYHPAIGLSESRLSFGRDFQIIISPKLWDS